MRPGEGARLLALRVLLGGVLLLAPLVLPWVAPSLGTRRGVWVTLAGVLLGARAERVLRPAYLSQRRWMAGSGWWPVALGTGAALGLALSLADGARQGASWAVIAEQLWIPLYRSLLLAAGLTLLRRAWWEWRHQSAGRGTG